MIDSLAMQSDITKFRNPHSTRNKIGRVLWAIVYCTLFRPTPWFMHGWRTFLLRCFGAKIKRAQFKPRVEIWSPWNLEIGEDVFIDYDVILYSAYGIKIGDRVILSKGAFLCTPTHDLREAEFPLTGGQITLGNDVWIAAQALRPIGTSRVLFPFPVTRTTPSSRLRFSSFAAASSEMRRPLA